jgi:hypothetical protein
MKVKVTFIRTFILDRSYFHPRMKVISITDMCLSVYPADAIHQIMVGAFVGSHAGNHLWLLLGCFDRCIQGIGASNQRHLLKYGHSILGSNVAVEAFDRCGTPQQQTPQIRYLNNPTMPPRNSSADSFGFVHIGKTGGSTISHLL